MRRRGLRACAAAIWFLTLTLPLHLGVAGSDEPVQDDIEAALTRARPYLWTAAPEFTAGERSALRRGESVTRVARDAATSPYRVAGSAIVQADLASTWVCWRDPHLAPDGRMVVVRLGAGPGGSERVYGYVDLPWPIADRHWVTDMRHNLELDRATEGGAWERRWDLAPDGPPVADELLKAGRVPGVDAQAGGHPIVPPVNEGSFLAVALDAARTLVTYQVSTDIGGDVPERAVADFARLRLKKALRTLMAHAPGAARHYDAHHAPILGGGGVLLPTGGLAGAAR